MISTSSSWLISWIGYFILSILIVGVAFGAAQVGAWLLKPVLWVLGTHARAGAGVVQVPPGHRPAIPPDVRIKVLERDGWQCVYCGSKDDLQIDHIIPWSRGGATTEGNLEVLCGYHNREKGAR